MHKSSPPTLVAGLGKTEVTAAEAVPTTFVDISTDAIDTRGGKVSPTDLTKAAVPNWNLYDTGRILFGAVVLNVGSITGLTVQLWGQDAQEVPMLLGSVDADASGQLPPIEGFAIIAGMQYATRVSALAGTDEDISFAAFAQGYFREDG